jgi:hypothetical protein
MPPFALFQRPSAASSQESYGHAIDEFIGGTVPNRVWLLTDLSLFAIDFFSNR